jgi:hypothetical protein
MLDVSRAASSIVVEALGMPQNVPAFRFGDDALRVRQFVYDHWCSVGRAPNLRELHEATTLPRGRLVEVLRELDLGLIVTIQQDTQNVAILKAQPFSSYPSQVAVHLDGRFHCWAGCAMESIAHLEDAALRRSDARRSNRRAPAASRRSRSPCGMATSSRRRRRRP